MAENAQTTLPSNTPAAQVTGVDGVATHLLGGNGANAEADNSSVKAIIPGLLRTPFDSEVVKMGWSTTPINAMTRDMGFKPLKVMEYGYYSVDLRPVEDALGAAIAETGYTANKTVTITVKDGNKFDVTDVIIFEGVNGIYKDESGQSHTGATLAARVSAKNGNTLSVQFLNAGATVNVNNNTPVYILGHAAAEIDASTTPYAALPNKSTQYMQKFMVQSLISTVLIESEKEVDWGKADINELLMQQFVEDIEKTYIWGVRSYTFDNTTHLYTRTTSGIVEQLIMGGVSVKPISLTSDGKLEKEDVFDMVVDTFVGNSGSNQRYMYTGIDFAKAFFSIDGVQDWVNANDSVRKFEYDFTKIKVFNYTLLNAPHPLFDKMGWRKYALILDRQYIERRVFRSMDETALELKKTGAYDGESTVWSEISSVIVKYPKCHAIYKIQ